MTDTTLEKRENNIGAPERVRAGRAFVPAVDILENADALLLMADVPGARAEDIEIQFEKGELSLYARIAPRPAAENASFVLREYGVGDYRRTFLIGETVDASKISAEVRQGVLCLRLPKIESVKTRKIPVKSE